MIGRATRLMTFVVLLLGTLYIGNRYQEIVQAASQTNHQNQTVKVYIPYLPIIPPQPTTELEIIRMGLFQSVQSSSNDVSLIAGKPAMLRVYAQSLQSTGEQPAATVTVEARRDGYYLGTLSLGPRIVSTNPEDDELASTFNFDLPTEWLNGQVTLTATIDPANALIEFDEGNNTLSAPLTFQDVPALDLTIVPIRYFDTRTGIIFTQEAYDPITPWLLSAYSISEINVTLHAPLDFVGDLRLGDDWSRLLNDLTALWAAEAGLGSAHVYYGLVPNSAPGGQSWFPGGISGMGWIGQRVSAGMDFGDETGINAAHEIGHNFGRLHAPCGNPEDVDPDFPYPNALIGVYGVDTVEEVILAPEETHDVMSYCGPKWVSDYTYEALMRDQMIKGRQVGSQVEGTLFSATYDPIRQAFQALPVIHVARTFSYPQARGASSYQIQLIDADGSLLGSYPATLFRAEENGVVARLLMAFVPSSAAGDKASTIRFLEGNEIIVEQSITGPTID